MSGTWATPVDRARQELHAARVMLDAGLSSQAVVHAYAASYDAAVAALQSVGELPATETGVISSFGRRVVADGGLDRELGRVLRTLYEDRQAVDRALLVAPMEEAERALVDAERLVDAVRRWIERH